MSPASDDSSYLAVPLARPQHGHRQRPAAAPADYLHVHNADGCDTSVERDYAGSQPLCAGELCVHRGCFAVAGAFYAGGSYCMSEP